MNNRNQVRKKKYNPELSSSTLQSVVEERGNYYFKGLIHIRWRDVISQHPGHSHGYKSVMAALLKANIRMVYLHK